MSYFDHVACPACEARFDPEKVGAGRGRLSCPNCNAMLELKDLFGLADAFAEEDQPRLTLDDLVPGEHVSGEAAQDPDLTLDHLLPMKPKPKK